VFHFVWHLPFDLFGLGDPASTYATTDIALRVIGARKPHHHDKVETHGGFIWIIHKNPDRASQETDYVSAAKPIRLMLFRKIIAVHCENHKKHINALCR
jgi:hypothetical protein